MTGTFTRYSKHNTIHYEKFFRDDTTAMPIHTRVNNLANIEVIFVRHVANDGKYSQPSVQRGAETHYIDENSIPKHSKNDENHTVMATW